MPRFVLPLLLAATTVASACAQRDEIIAIAPDDEEGGGGAGGSATGGGGGLVIATLSLPAPDCGGSLDEMAVGAVDAGEGADLVVGGDGCVSLYAAEGDALGDPLELSAGAGQALALGRLHTTTPTSDGDAPDLVRASDDLVVLTGDGLGGFTPTQVLPLVSPVQPGGLVLGSMGGNGALDLVYGDAGHVIIRYGNGDGTFGDEHPFAVQGGGLQIGVGDLDDDGEADIVTAGSSASVLLADGQGAFHAPQALDGGDHIGVIALGHLDGDGCIDAAGVEGRPFAPGDADARLRLWLGDCQGHLSPHASMAVPGATGLALGDFDHDGHFDAAVTLADGLALLTFDASGTLLAEHVVPLEGTPRRALPIDVNSDGRLAIAVTAGDRVYVVEAM